MRDGLIAIPDGSVTEPVARKSRDFWAGSLNDFRLDWAMLSSLLAALGMCEDATWAARNALSTECSEREFRDAARALLEVGGATAVSEVVERTPPDAAYQLVAVRALLDVDKAAAVDLAWTCLSHVDAKEIQELLDVVVTGEDDADRLMRAVLDNWEMSQARTGRIATWLVYNGFHTEARQITTMLLASRPMSKPDYRRVTWILTTLANGTATVLADAEGRPAALRAQLVGLLHRTGRFDESAALMRGVIKERPPLNVLVMMGAEWYPPPAELMSAILDRIDDCEYSDLPLLASILRSAARTEEANELLARAFRHAIHVEDGRLDDALVMMLDHRGAGVADSIVRDILAEDLSAIVRLDAAECLARSGLLPQAANIWLNVAVHHGEDVGAGTTAADLLIRTGYRTELEAALEQALAVGRMSAATRKRLRALQSWCSA